MALKEKLSFPLLLWRGSPHRTAGTGNLWLQCVKSAGSWCGMWQDQLRSCPARPGMPQPRASGCQTPRDEPLPGSATWHRAALPLALPSSGAPWQFQAVNIWLCNSPLHYLAVASSKTPPLAFTTLLQQRLCRNDAKAKSRGMDVEVTGMRGLCGATHQQHLHKPKAWSRESVTILMFGDLAKTNVSRARRSAHLSTSKFPIAAASLDQLPSALTHWHLLASARAQGNTLEGHLDIFLAAERRLSNPLEFDNGIRIIKTIILAAQGWGCLLPLTL